MATTPAAVGPPACLACAVTRATWIIPRGHRPVRESNSIKKAGAISAPKWSREFEDPIVLADGRKILTLRDAATYITKLPKPEQDLEIVVSGLAKGIDTAALTAAIKNKHRVAAVIGTPLDKAYPAENKALQQHIYSHHLLLTRTARGRQFDWHCTCPDHPRRKIARARAGPNVGKFLESWD